MSNEEDLRERLRSLARSAAETAYVWTFEGQIDLGKAAKEEMRRLAREDIALAETEAAPSTEENILAAIRHTQAAHRAATEVQDETLASDLVMAHKALEKAMVRAQRARLGLGEQDGP